MRIDHIALFCRDLEGMRQFFIDHFSALSNEQYHNPRTGLRTYILTFPDGGARLEIMQRPDTVDADPSKPNIGFVHVSFAVGSTEGVDSKTAELVNAGYKVTCGPGLDIRGWGEMNSFNGPNWSLTLEYCGNILYAFVFRHLPKIALAILCVVCAFFTLDLTLGWDVFGFFPDGPQYTVIGGWSLTGQQLYIGFTRLLYPFLCGLLISRILPSHRTESNPSGSPIHLKGGFWWCCLALVVLFSIPCIGGTTGVPDGLYQAVCILLLFPIIVLAGSGSVTTDKKSTAVCKWLELVRDYLLKVLAPSSNAAVILFYFAFIAFHCATVTALYFPMRLFLPKTTAVLTGGRV